LVCASVAKSATNSRLPADEIGPARAILAQSLPRLSWWRQQLPFEPGLAPGIFFASVKVNTAWILC